MRSATITFAVNDAGDGLTIVISGTGFDHAGEPTELPLAELSKKIYSSAAAQIGTLVLGTLRLGNPEVIAQYPDLDDSPDISPRMKDIEHASKLLMRSFTGQTTAWVPAIEKLLRTDPAKRASKHSFIAEWPALRKLLFDLFDRDWSK